MANYSFFTDVTGKKIRISDVASNIPCYISSSNEAVKIGSSTSYVVTASNGIAEAPLTFFSLQEASKEITVTAYGKYSNGYYTNEATTTITLKNALKGLIVTPSKTEIYTGENTTLTISAPNTAYGWGNNATVTLSATPVGSVTKNQGALSGTFSSPSALTSVSSINVGIIASTTAGQYSTKAISGSAQITVKQAATGISYNAVPTIYVGETKTFTCTLAPSNVYSKMVIINSGGNTNYYSASAITPTSNDPTTISILGKAAGTGTLTLQSADGKVTKDVRITITAKTKASITLSGSSSIILNPNQIDYSNKLTYTGCTISAGNINVSNSAVAIAELSGSYLNITARSAGTTRITVSGTPNTGYTAPDNKVVDVTVKNISIAVV